MAAKIVWRVYGLHMRVLADFPTQDDARYHWLSNLDAFTYNEVDITPKLDAPIEYDEFDQSED
jgi:hypothetical protein